ncbi:heparan-alpha-glucosaminide N-acetyltransferase domain-containing protein [Fulvivirgaceae bacterium BMA10]|uniref:Heparan-alpha-glucosaminide N-acetyltransferase domain-containing protein n=1 Tax=Splendidivirga corallicola TaxID=3051826 RepID=A0ABT8KLI7_9BACT|nr:heparan-alpha-glucosaminide N-acetyltransferase domain-containing protein [Fulvivirgaceae bacterium BMA10]
MTQSKRLISLDVFRGATIAAMILVNNPGSWSTVYPPLLHAKWHGCTPTDLVFPFFLFIVGISISLAYTKRKESGEATNKLIQKIVWRSLKIFLLGLFLSGFPFFNFETIRIPGVLQRISVVFLICSLLFLKTNWRTQAILGAFLLVLYNFLMTVVPVPGIGQPNLNPETNLGAWLDNLLLSGHLWSQTKVWDPEGLLSTIPAIVTGITGLLTGKLFLDHDKSPQEKVIWMFVAGCFGIFLGMVWGIYFPINKALWTSSYVMYTSGIGLLIFALCYWFIDILDKRSWINPFVIYGSNAITVYVLSGVIAKSLYLIKWETSDGIITLQGWTYNTLFLSWLPPYNASLGYAILNVLLLLGVAWILYRKRIFIKV